MDIIRPKLLQTHSLRHLILSLALVLSQTVAVLAAAAAPPDSSPAAAADTVCQSPASLQSCINATPAGGIVLVAPTTWTESVTINKALTLRGVTYQTTILQAPPSQRVITITGGGAVHLEHLTIQGGAAGSQGGGGIQSQNGDLYITDCLVRNNSASYGGGLFQTGTPAPTVYVANSSFDTNQATVHGGGLMLQTADLVTSDTIVQHNTAGGHGGGIHAGGATTSLTRGSINHNVAGLNGGGVNLDNAITVEGTILADNSAGRQGGGITQWNAGQAVLITGATFIGNSATIQGGGMFARGSTVINGSTFLNNSVNSTAVDAAGGGLCLWADAPASAGSLIISDSVFEANTVTSAGTGTVAGAGLYANSSATTISASRVTGNLLSTTVPAPSAKGAGAYVATGPLTVTDTTIQSNQITAAAGAIYVLGGGIEADHLPQVTVTGSKFIGNKGWFGGALSCDYVTRCVVEDSQFDGNNGGYGAGIDAVSVEVRRSSFTNNTAMNEGAAIAAGGAMTVERARIANNSAGLSAVWATGGLALSNVLLVDNTTGMPLGADVHIENPTTAGRSLKQVTIAAAVRKQPSTGVYQDVNVGSTSLTMDNTIIANHATGVNIAAGSLVQNNSLYGLNTTNVSGSSSGNVGMVYGDPLFANPAAGDFHLRWGSPAIDGGADLGITVDLDGFRRVRRPDIGAYEWLATRIFISALRR